MNNAHNIPIAIDCFIRMDRRAGYTAHPLWRRGSGYFSFWDAFPDTRTLHSVLFSYAGRGRYQTPIRCWRLSRCASDPEMYDCTVLNLKNGEIFSPSLSLMPSTNLTNREIEVLRLIQKGLLSKEIADKLCISIHTVNIHRQNLLRKLGVQNSIEAIRLGQESGLLS